MGPPNVRQSLASKEVRPAALGPSVDPKVSMAACLEAVFQAAGSGTTTPSASTNDPSAMDMLPRRVVAPMTGEAAQLLAAAAGR